MLSPHTYKVGVLLLLWLFTAYRLEIISAKVQLADEAQAETSERSAAASQVARQEIPYYFQAERLVHRELTKSPASKPGGAEQSGPRRHIRVVSVVSPPFMMKRERVQEAVSSSGSSSDESSQPTGSRTTVEWYGYCMDFFEELIKHLPYKVSYEIYEAPDKKFGSKTREILFEQTKSQNKSQPKRRERWNGMIGELARGRAHLALAPISVMAERELAVDFTVPFYDLVGIQILLKRPEVPRDWFKFLTVLDNEVWLSITLAYFVTAFIIYLFDRLSPYSHKNMKRVEKIRARRHQRDKEQAASASGGGQSVWSVERPTFGATSGNTFTSSVKPLSKQHEALMGAPPLPPPPTGVVYPLMATNPRLVEAIRHPAANKIFPEALLATPDSSTSQSAQPSFSNRARRLSQDYLQSLPHFRRHHHKDSPPTAQQREEDPSDDSDQSEEDPGAPDFNLRDSLWFCITSLTPQGGGEAPQNLSGRVVAGAWWLFCFIVIASYTANLAAFLTVSRLDIPIESLDDLAKQYRIKYAPIEGTAEQSFFERMAYIEEIFYNIWKEMSLNDSLSEEDRSKFAVWDYPISDKYTKIWAQIQEVQMPTSLGQAIERVKASTLDDGFALLANANIIRYATMTDCSFRAVGEEFSRKPIALALQKNQDSLRDDLSYAILQLINRRYMEVLREKWWTNNPDRVVCDLNDESEGISIENIGGVFLIILAGVLLSFLVWAAERFLYRTKLEVSRELLQTAPSRDLNSSQNGRKFA